MLKERDFRAQLSRFLSLELTLDELEEWVVAHLDESICAQPPLAQWMDTVDVELMRFRDGMIGFTELVNALEAVLKSTETLHFSSLESADNSERNEATIYSGDISSQVPVYRGLVPASG